MEIVNINDIEDLIINKYFIEQKFIEDGIIEQKMSIEEFINKYARADLIYKVHNENIPFGFRKINNKDYLFVISKDETTISLLSNKLKLLKYDLNNLVKIRYEDLLRNEHINEEEFIIKDADYYK